MDYFNPFMRNTQMAPAQPMYRQQQPLPQINPQQFRQFAITLNDTALNNFAQMARAQGISEQDIQRGIQFIKSL
jgi:hypothetical protein